MKKLLSLLVVLIAMFVVTGCDNTNQRDREIVIPDQFTTEPVTITFWHGMGQANQGYIQDMIDDFNVIYPNITVIQAGQGGYTDLRDKITKAISAGTEPNIAQTYPDHVAVYLQGRAVLPLDKYMEHETFGFTQADLDDFVPSFLAEGTIYDEAGTYYSLPFNKSTEVMFYNKTFFTQHSLTVPTTWAELRTVALQIKAINNKVAFAYDSEANLFITLTEQWGGAYTNVNGEILFNNLQSKAAITYFRNLYTDGLAATPTHFDGANYASDVFKAETIYMTVGSSAGAQHNNTTAFEVGVAPVPQFDGTGAKPAAIQQGTNLTIFSNATDNQRLASWLFVKFLTDTAQTAYFSASTAYFPVRESAYTHTTYASFLANPASIFVKSATIGYSQRDRFFTSAAFPGSSLARDEAQSLIRAVLYGGKAIDTAYADAINELVW